MKRSLEKSTKVSTYIFMVIIGQNVIHVFLSPPGNTDILIGKLGCFIHGEKFGDMAEPHLIQILMKLDKVLVLEQG